MIPVLYDPTDVRVQNGAHIFESGGYGYLGDVISCTITEELNGSYELEMVYPVDGVHFDEIKINRLIYSKANESMEYQLFRIYLIEKPINGRVTVHGEHISYLLNKSICFPFECKSAAAAFSYIAYDKVLWRGSSSDFPEYPFTFWTDDDAEGEIKIETPKSVKSVLYDEILNGLNSSGDYEFDNFRVKYHKHRGKSESDVTLMYGKNIVDLTGTEDLTDTFTGIVPYWKGSIKHYRIEHGEGEDARDRVVSDSEQEDLYISVDKGQRVIWDPYGHDEYYYPMLNVMDFSSNIDVSEMEDADPTDDDGEDLNAIVNAHNAFEETVRTQIRNSLRDLGNEYYQKNAYQYWTKENITISFAQLWTTEEYKEFAPFEQVSMGDLVKVEYGKLGIYIEKRVIKTVFNVLLDRYDSIELGDKETSTNSVSTSIINSVSNSTVEEVKEQVNGYVDFRTTEEYLRAKQEAIQRAQKYAEETVFVNSKAYTDQAAEDAREAWRLFGSNDAAADVSASWEYIKEAKRKYEILSETSEERYQRLLAHEQTMAEHAETMADHAAVMAEHEQTMAAHEQTMATLDEEIAENAQAIEDMEQESQEIAQRVVNEYNNYLNQTAIFNKLTQNGAKKGITLANNGDLYFNANYINAGTINGDYIDAGTLRADRIVTGSITNVQLGSDCVQESHIYGGAVTENKLGPDAVTRNKIKDGEIVYGKIAPDAVHKEQIMDGEITALKLGDNAVTARTIEGEAIHAQHILANEIKGYHILAGEITSEKIGTGEIYAINIHTDAVTSDKILGGEVTADKIRSHCITTNQIAAGGVSASVIDADGIAGKQILGGVITGVTIQTAQPNNITRDANGDAHINGLRLEINGGQTAIKGIYHSNSGQDMFASGIDFGQAYSGSNYMALDAKNGIHIRTPKIYVVDRSVEAGNAIVDDVELTATNHTFEFVTHVEKDYEGTSEITVDGVCFTVPVWIKYETGRFTSKLGFVINPTGGGTYTERF